MSPWRTALISSRNRHENPCRQHWLTAIFRLSTINFPGRTDARSSSPGALLSKFEIAFINGKVKEAWVIFNELETGSQSITADSLRQRLICLISYSCSPHWLKKATGFVSLLLKRKSESSRNEAIASELSLSLARAQMPFLASMILYQMLERKCLLPTNILRLVVFHMVKSEMGMCLASNFLVWACDSFLNGETDKHVKVIKQADTLIFNLVLEACVRYKAPVKGQQLLECMSRTGIAADAHSIIIIAQIHEMNGQRDDLKKFKPHVDQVSSLFRCFYCQFYDSLLNLHLKFDDIDAAAELLLDVRRCQSVTLADKKWKARAVPIASHNLREGLKIKILPELRHKDSILKVEHKQGLVKFKNGRIMPSKRALAKLIIGCRRNERISQLPQLLLKLEDEQESVCLVAIDACISLDWLETAHDILNGLTTAGVAVDFTVHLKLLAAYQQTGKSKEAKALEMQISNSGLLPKLPDGTSLSKAMADASSSRVCKSDLALCLLQESRNNDEAIPPVVYEINSSLYFFCKAQMMGEALQAYRTMQERKIQPTIQTFTYLINGYSSLKMYRDITFLWGDIKRIMETQNMHVSWEICEMLLLNMLRGGYFERVMEIIGYMEEHNMCLDKWLCRNVFSKLHRNLYRRLHESNTRTDAQSKRLEWVRLFKKWVRT